MSHFRVPLRRALSGLLVAAAACAALPAHGQAIPSDNVLRGFQRTGEFLLLINGQADSKAEVYVNRNIPAYLILPSAGLSPILITPGAGKVETVPMPKVARKQDGTVDLLADAVMKPQGKFQLVGERVDFNSEGKKVSLSPKPPLIGPKKAADLKAHSPEYMVAARSYTPNAQAVAALKKQPQAARVLVFFGSWCPHCKELLPHLLRVEDEIRGSKIQIDYRGIPRDFKDPEVQRLSVRNVPTAIVYVNGREVGRFNTNDWNAPEAALLRMVGGAAKSGK
jgi:thiol-disulfide isomerase/thioredoxin